MKTMIALATLGAMSLGLTGMSRAPSVEPSARRMAAVAYKVPLPRIDRAITALRRDFKVADADIPQALGVLAHCGKTGAVEFGDLVDGVAATGPAWDARMHHPAIERAFGIKRDGLADVQRLCRTLEVARRGHGSSPEAIASTVAVLKSSDREAVVARTLMSELELDEVDGIREIRGDYRMRVGLDR